MILYTWLSNWNYSWKSRSKTTRRNN